MSNTNNVANNSNTNNEGIIYNVFFKLGFGTRRAVVHTRTDVAAEYVASQAKQARDGLVDGWNAGANVKK